MILILSTAVDGFRLRNLLIFFFQINKTIFRYGSHNRVSHTNVSPICIMAKCVNICASRCFSVFCFLFLHIDWFGCCHRCRRSWNLCTWRDEPLDTGAARGKLCLWLNRPTNKREKKKCVVRWFRRKCIRWRATTCAIRAVANMFMHSWCTTKPRPIFHSRFIFFIFSYFFGRCINGAMSCSTKCANESHSNDAKYIRK